MLDYWNTGMLGYGKMEKWFCERQKDDASIN
jgi:hypothetical protein